MLFHHRRRSIHYTRLEVGRYIDRCLDMQASQAGTMPLCQVERVSNSPLTRLRPVDVNQDIVNHVISSARRNNSGLFLVPTRKVGVAGRRLQSDTPPDRTITRSTRTDRGNHPVSYTHLQA